MERLRQRLATVDWPWLALLAGLFVVALALRVWSVGHGMPYAYNVDEDGHFAPVAVGLMNHGWNPHYFENPPAFTYLLKLIFTARWGQAGTVNTWIVDPTPIWLTARWTAAVLGSLSCVLTAVAGRRLFNKQVGVIAGLVLATATLPVLYAHFALNDVPATFPVLLVLIAAINLRGDDNRLRDYLLAGLGIGLAASTKYTAAIVVVALMVAVLPKGRGAIKGLCLTGGAAALSFFITNPFAILDLHAFREGLTLQSDFAARKLVGLGDTTGILYYGRTLTWGLGWLPFAAAIAGAVWMLTRKPERSKALLLLSMPVALLLALSLNLLLTGEGQAYSRWLLPAYPFLCLLAAWLVVAFARTGFPNRRRLATGVIVGATALLCLQGVWQSVRVDRILSKTDTRQSARNWMVANVPRDTLVALDPYVVPPAWGQNTFWAKPPLTGQPGDIWKVAMPFVTTLNPSLVTRFQNEGRCWVVQSSTITDRALSEPAYAPGAVGYRKALDASSVPGPSWSPWKASAGHPKFDFDRSYLYFDGAYRRPGPLVTVRRLFGARCGSRSQAIKSVALANKPA